MKLQLADRIVAGIRAAARERGLQPISVVVLDSGGHVICAVKEDGAANKRFEIAYAKAHGAVSLGMDSRRLMVRAEQQPYFISAVTSAIGGNLIPVPGGVLVRGADGQLLGAVGVSGDTSDNDEAVAVAGIELVGLCVSEKDA